MKDKTKYPDHIWATCSWPEIEERLKKVDTAILPCGAIEQHGPHLPLDVDYFDAEYLAKAVADSCSDPKPFVLPAIPYGVSYHHMISKGHWLCRTMPCQPLFMTSECHWHITA